MTNFAVRAVDRVSKQPNFAKVATQGKTVAGSAGCSLPGIAAAFSAEPGLDQSRRVSATRTLRKGLSQLKAKRRD